MDPQPHTHNMKNADRTHSPTNVKMVARLSKPRRTPTHHLTLTHQLGIELGPVEREIDIEVNAVKRALRRVHALKVLFEVFA
jgi:hypothetical protein